MKHLVIYIANRSTELTYRTVCLYLLWLICLTGTDAQSDSMDTGKKPFDAGDEQEGGVAAAFRHAVIGSPQSAAPRPDDVTQAGLVPPCCSCRLSVDS